VSDVNSSKINEYLNYTEVKDLENFSEKKLASNWQKDYDDLSNEVKKIMIKNGNRIPKSGSEDFKLRSKLISEMKAVEYKAKEKWGRDWIFNYRVRNLHAFRLEMNCE
jgi:hypothetical protein